MKNPVNLPALAVGTVLIALAALATFRVRAAEPAALPLATPEARAHLEIVTSQLRGIASTVRGTARVVRPENEWGKGYFAGLEAGFLGASLRVEFYTADLFPPAPPLVNVSLLPESSASKK